MRARGAWPSDTAGVVAGRARSGGLPWADLAPYGVARPAQELCAARRTAFAAHIADMGVAAASNQPPLSPPTLQSPVMKRAVLVLSVLVLVAAVAHANG